MDGSRFRVVVNKSTVPVGSGNLVETLVREGVLEKNPELSDSVAFGVASNPEFLREGSAIPRLSLSRTASWWAPKTPTTIDIMRQLYKPLMDQTFAEPSFAPRPNHLQQDGTAPVSDGGDHNYQRRNDQIFREMRFSRSRSAFSKRNCEHLRARMGADVTGGDARDRAGCAYRARIPECRYRLGRKLLWKGHQLTASYCG